MTKKPPAAWPLASEEETREFLSAAVFCPAVGLDPRPVSRLGGRFKNFIYADPGFGLGGVERALSGSFSPGYECLGIENLPPEPLLGFAWKALPEPYGKWAPRVKKPFIELARLKKGKRPAGGEETRLIFIRGEPLAVHGALYRRRGLAPSCLAYLPPGPQDDSPFPHLLAWQFVKPPARLPAFLLHNYSGMNDRADGFFALHPLFPESVEETKPATASPDFVFRKLMDPIDEREVKIAQFAAFGALRMRQFWGRVEERARQKRKQQTPRQRL